MLNFYKYHPYNNYYSQKSNLYNQSNYRQNIQPKNTYKYPSNITRANSKNPPPVIPPTAHPFQKPHPRPPPCKPPKKKNLPPKKKFNFKSLKKDTCTSLNDVECFLNNFSSFIKYLKLINLLK